MTVSIVIPAYNHWDLTHSLLFSLYTQEKDRIDEVMLVDDASDDAEVVGGERWWKENGMLPLRVFRFEENQGFLKAANKGLRKSTGDIKVLISNDVKIKQPFIESLKDVLKQDSNRLVGNVYFNRNTGWNEFNGELFPFLSGHFLAATAEAWEKLGYFDERYCPCNYEDVDLSTTARKMGMGLVSLALPNITHVGGATIAYGEERDELTKRNQEKFIDKWVRNHEK